MLIPLEGCVVAHSVDFITRGAQKLIIDVNMLRKEEIIRNFLRSVPRNEDIVQWIVSPQVLPCFGETRFMTSVLVFLWQKRLDCGTGIREIGRRIGGQSCLRLSIRAPES